ncbi:hypothetical protein G112A_00426 [Candidatus Nanosynsacchari sp. TM7_G1_3_12Alb]|nr:hypothetical protein G112A_00426 [Candidatus Nanosynsacchari sp. TM7_G1_3_12Alb]
MYQAQYFIKTDHDAITVGSRDELSEVLMMVARSADLMLEHNQVITIELRKTTIDGRIVLAAEELDDVLRNKLYGYSVHFTAVDFSTATTTLSDARCADL